MHRWLLAVAAILCIALLAVAQHDTPRPTHEPGGQPHGAPVPSAPGHDAGEHDEARWTMWKIANFAILAFALGYLMAKKGTPFFSARTGEIRKGIAEASAQKRAAEARFAEIERRLASLDSEVAAMRTGAIQEMNAESERIRQETAQRLAKIHAQAEQEIASIAKAARQDLKEYAASLAIGIAEQRIRERMTPETQNELVAAFARSVSDGGSR